MTTDQVAQQEAATDLWARAYEDMGTALDHLRRARRLAEEAQDEGGGNDDA
jgi:hypothetical protein